MRRSLAGLLGATALALTALTQPAFAGEPATAPDTRALADVIPIPVSAIADPKADFRLTPATAIEADRGARQVADYLAGLLRPSTGYRLPVVERTSAPSIALELGPTARVGDQGYQLTVTKKGVTLRANSGDGLFAGVQTLRQLLPARVESRQVARGPWIVPGGKIVDYPRFAYRGAMLDVARHFFAVDEVKRYIDQIAQYKVNRLHLHLADDQGWRIEIKSWPRLATYGGSTEVGGGPGGYYTQEQYKDLVAYAASRHITVIPEIDMPGHTNAALASYAELNCDGVAPPLYTGIEVGFSSLCVDKDITYEFLDDVIGELAALTPGRYLHIGGDEAHATTPEDYQKFMGQVLPIVAKHGKLAQGWHEIAKADPPVSAVPQFWDTDGVDADTAAAAAAGNKIVVSPANKAYLDMQYNENSPLGLHWAGYVEVSDAYDWDPSTAVQGVGEASVAGVEAPLWSETLTDSDDIEFMAFPRLPGIAEIGWSPKSTHDWNDYRERLAQQAPRWEIQGIDFYRSPQVDWP
ncbi:beta-N-acetylhexosaminidase [Amycolatopsis thermoflava]|uniref:beta-N-acetylhexosaminidase n=1 Tax=Amycolatopsis thermoflava TaxID=84480 RepID=UPI003EC012A3